MTLGEPSVVDLRAGRVHAILAVCYLAFALCCLAVVVGTWVLGRPLAFVATVTNSWVSLGLSAALLPGLVIGIIEQIRGRFAGDDERPKAGGSWARLSAVAIGLVMIGVLAGMSPFGRAGSPSAARDNCAYPLRQKGNVFTCVSAAEYRLAGARTQRSGAAVCLALSAAVAGTFIGVVRRRRA